MPAMNEEGMVPTLMPAELPAILSTQKSLTARYSNKRHALVPQTTTQPLSKRMRRGSFELRAQQISELRRLLLTKVNRGTSSPDDHLADKILSEEYSPRILQLLESIATDEDTDVEYGSENTSPLSEGTSDAVVPSFNSGTVGVEYLATPTTKQLKVPSLSKPLRPITVNSNEATVPSLEKPVKKVEVPVYKKETEIAISRIFDLGKVAAVADPSIPMDAPYDGPSVVTMTGFGELGRWGNQVLQYVFLKCYAARYGIKEIQVPAWVGAALFGFNDRPVQRAFPPVVEFRGTLANSTFTTEFIDYVKRSHSERGVPELNYDVLDMDKDTGMEHKNVDIWGWFQWHSSHFRPYKLLIQNTFRPIPSVEKHMSRIFGSKIRNLGGIRRTVVGLHLRLGDYQNIAASSFGYCAPTEWYIDWLNKIWPTLENPVLFVASDDINAVLRDFAEFNPITGDSVGLSLPEEMKGTKAGFFPDWYSLTQCDVLAISNSTFSFSACMMNQRPNVRCFRAHYSGSMVQFDPWNAEPIIHRDISRNAVLQAVETLQVLYNTQGSRGVARNLLYELPYYGIRAAVMKAVLWKKSYAKQLQV